MMIKMRKALKGEKGFTLIELMIVVAIIGILAAIAIPNFLRFQMKAKAAESRANLQAINNAQRSYYGDRDSFLACAISPTDGVVGKSKIDWQNGDGSFDNDNDDTDGLVDFSAIGWRPTGGVYYQYQVAAGAADANGFSHEFAASAMADIDGDGTTAYFSYISMETNGAGILPPLGNAPLDAANNTVYGAVAKDMTSGAF